MFRVGIVGAGGIGNVHARQYRKRSDVELSVFDHSEGRARAFQERWDATPVDSFENLVRRVDVLDLCLPTPVHKDFALKAIAAGVPSLIEKPLARTLKDAVEIAEASRNASVPIMAAHVVRFFPEYAAAKRVVASGGIGTPSAARARRGGGAPSGADGWFMDHTKSGGPLLDLSIHDFDWLRWCLGEVKSLYSRTVGAQTEKGPDFALTTLTFESGCVAHVEGTWMDPGGFRTHFEIAGSKGLIQHESRNNIPLRTTIAPEKTEGAPLPNLDGNSTPKEDPYYLEIDGFLNAVKNGTELPVTLVDALSAVAIGEAAIESAKTGKVVAPERFA